MKTLTSVLAVAMMALVGCATDDSSSATINDTAMTGMIGGQTWTFAAGHTSAFLSEGEPDFFATLYPMTFTTCGFSEPAGNHLIVAIPKTPGEYEMSLSRNMTFVGDSNNLIATDGKIVVDEVTATTVKGGLVSTYDGQNKVNGRFEVTICPD